MDTKTFIIKIGNRVKALREKKHMTQQQLADISGTSIEFIKMLEEGEADTITPQIIAAAEAFGIEVA